MVQTDTNPQQSEAAPLRASDIVIRDLALTGDRFAACKARLVVEARGFVFKSVRVVFDRASGGLFVSPPCADHVGTNGQKVHEQLVWLPAGWFRPIRDAALAAYTAALGDDPGRLTPPVPGESTPTARQPTATLPGDDDPITKFHRASR